jgi:hypothetical protein
MVIRALFVIVLVTSSFVPLRAAQDPEPTPALVELILLSGTSLKPAGAPSFGAALGVGWGERGMVTFEVSHSDLGNNPLGVQSQGPPNQPISESRLLGFTGNFEVDVLRRNTRPRIAPYFAIGMGVISSKFVAPLVTCCFNPRPLTEWNHRGFAAGGGGGVRIPITRAIGIQPRLKVWAITGGDEFSYIRADTTIQAGIGIYFRGFSN